MNPNKIDVPLTALERISVLETQIEDRDAQIADIRDKLAASYIQLSGKTVHASDCATSNSPAQTPGRCDCLTTIPGNIITDADFECYRAAEKEAFGVRMNVRDCNEGGGEKEFIRRTSSIVATYRHRCVMEATTALQSVLGLLAAHAGKEGKNR